MLTIFGDTDLLEQEKLLHTERGLSSRTNPHNHGAISRTWRMQNEAWWRLTSAARAVKKHVICRSTKSVKSNGLRVESRPEVQLTPFYSMYLWVFFLGGGGTGLLIFFFGARSLTHLCDPTCSSSNCSRTGAESCSATVNDVQLLVMRETDTIHGAANLPTLLAHR